MQTEVTITIKGEDCTFKKKFLCYEEIRATQECAELTKMVDQAKFEFKGPVGEVLFKITGQWE